MINGVRGCLRGIEYAVEDAYGTAFGHRQLPQQTGDVRGAATRSIACGKAKEDATGIRRRGGRPLFLLSPDVGPERKEVLNDVAIGFLV